MSKSAEERLENTSPIGVDLEGNLLVKPEDWFWLQEQAGRTLALEETLEFYADANNHPIVFTAIERDGGYRARKELGRLEKWEIARE